MASSRKMLIEIFNYGGFISGDSVSYLQCSGQLGGGALILHGHYSVPKPLGVCATGCTFLFEKASLCFPNCLCILVPNFPEKLHIAGLFNANAVHHRMFLCWSRAVRSGVNQGLYLFLVQFYLNGACLFKDGEESTFKE